MMAAYRRMDQAANQDGLRVTLLAPTWPPMRCGIAPYAERLTTGLAATHADVRVVTSAQAGQSELISCRLEDWTLGRVLRLVLRIRALSPHIVHLQHPTRATRLKPAAYLLPLFIRLLSPRHRVVTTLHYARPVNLRTVARLAFLLPVVFSHAIVVTTPWEAQFIRRILWWKQVAVVPAGLTMAVPSMDRAQRQETRRDLGLSEDAFIVAFFGFLLPNKGLETLLQAVRRLPPSITLLVVGGAYSPTDSYPHTLRALAAELGIEERVRWVDSATDEQAVRLLSCADCAALLFDEGASLKRSSLLVSAACGLPIVSTTGPEVENVLDVRSILLVPPGDPEALVGAIGTLVADPSVGERLREGSKGILAETGWDRIVAAHLHLYRSLCP